VDLRWRNAVYLICIALAVALGVRIVGGLMTAALLAIPACTAKNISRNLGQYAAISGAAGGLSAVLGILGYAAIDISPGPLIIIAGGFLFLGSVYLKVRRERAGRS
jgi:ABC-type Mn2+/Zn2+ transport system permease subunit